MDKLPTSDLAMEEEQKYWKFVVNIAAILCFVMWLVLFTIGPLAPYPKRVGEYFFKEKVTQYTTPTIPSGKTPIILEDSHLKQFEAIMRHTVVDGFIYSTADFTKNEFTDTRSHYRGHADDSLASSKAYTLFGENTMFNTRILTMLEGEMECAPLTNLPDFKALIESKQASSAWSCGIAVPPVRDKHDSWFGGFLTVLLSESPSPEVKEDIIRIAFEVASNFR